MRLAMIMAVLLRARGWGFGGGLRGSQGDEQLAAQAFRHPFRRARFPGEAAQADAPRTGAAHGHIVQFRVKAADSAGEHVGLLSVVRASRTVSGISRPA